MKLKLRILWCAAITLWATSCFGQDQVETISGLKELPSHLPRPKSATLTRAAAETFVEEAFSGKTSSPDFHCIVHILKWKDNAKEVESHKWYVYRGGKWTDAQFTGKRIFGSKNVGVIYIHLMNGVTRASLKSQLGQLSESAVARFVAKWEPGKRSDSEQAERVKALLLLGKEKLAASAADLIWEDPSRVEIVGVPNDALEAVGAETSVPKSMLSVAYRVSITKRLPAPVQSLLSLVAAAQSMTPEKVQVRLTQPIVLWGHGEITLRHSPSDIKVQSLVEVAGETKELTAETYLNEGLYYWDVSVGVPVSKVKELEFSATDGTVRAKEIDKQKVFAFINIFPRPLDTEDMKIRNTPHLLFGVALSTKPLDRVFLGGGWGFNRVQFFAGAAFNKIEAPATLASGAPATQNQLQSDLRAKYETKFLMGLNVPVRQVLDAFKKK